MSDPSIINIPASPQFQMTQLPEEAGYALQILTHFHPKGLHCPHCGASVENSYSFRTTRKSKLIVYRCRCCQGIYNLYSQTIFEARHLRPSQVAQLIIGVMQDESSTTIAKRIKISRTTATELCHLLKDQSDFLKLAVFVANCNDPA